MHLDFKFLVRKLHSCIDLMQERRALQIKLDEQLALFAASEKLAQQPVGIFFLSFILSPRVINPIFLKKIPLVYLLVFISSLSELIRILFVRSMIFKRLIFS